jgi:hypothetical protein
VFPVGCWLVCLLVDGSLEFMLPWGDRFGKPFGKSRRTQATPTKRPGDHGGPTVPAWSPGA